nr:YEATS domain-containing protein 2-like isoform X1 [Procambarus clarkii]
MLTTEAQVSGPRPATGHSSCSSDADSNSKKMEDESSGDNSQVPGSKRMLSTEDPDYARPPDAKRMREMHMRAQDELSERVVKVVDKEFNIAINEKQAEMEEIDNRILRLQQCLHTLRYCVSLNYYSVKKTDEAGNKHKPMLHPTVRKHLGKAPVTHKAAAVSSLDESPQNSSSAPSVSTYQGAITSRLPQEECKGSVGAATLEEKPAIKDKIVSGSEDVCDTQIEAHDTTKDKCKEETDDNDARNRDLKSSRPPSPKYLPPKPPDNPQTIYQGRHQRFQSKLRVIVGNTYQYLTSHAEDDSTSDTLRYKWQVYVRAPGQGEDISSFISAVTFILDQSYAPHHIITLKHPPFVLTRRGWGEFKIQIVLRFTDSRNKQVRLLHPLVLIRPDDPLSLTGLWRLGQENWYDLWVYESDSGSPGAQQITEMMAEEEEDCPASLARELTTGVVSSRVEENITVVHNIGEKNITQSIKRVTPVKPENECKVLTNSDRNNVTKCANREISESVASSKQCTILQSHCDASSDTTLKTCREDKRQTVSKSESKIKVEGLEESKLQGLKPLKEQLGVRVANINGVQSKVCKIHVRQPDGRLVPYYIPAHMYSLALKIAQSGTNKQANGTTTADNKQVNRQEVIKQQSVSQRIIKVHIPEGQEKGGIESIIVKQEPSELLAQQRDDTKSVTLEVKTELEQNTKTSTTPIRILNFSPHKKVAINNEESISLMPSTSGIQGGPKLSHITQTKQTVARLSTGRLPQSPLQQLLVKAVQDKKHALVHQLLSKKGLKDGSGTHKSLQGQITYTQTPVGLKSNIQIMPLKVVQDMQSTGSPSTKIIQRPISAANIRFITNNGQLISAGKLMKGKTALPSSKVSASISSCSVPTSSNCVVASTSGVTPVSSNTTGMVMIQGNQQVAGSSGLQLGMSKGKATITQLPPLVVCSSAVETGTVLQIPPFVVRGVGNGETLKTITNSIKSTTSTTKNVTVPGVSLLRGSIITTTTPTVCSLLKPIAPAPSADTSSPTPVVTNVLTRVTSSTPVKTLSLNASSCDKSKISAVKVDKREGNGKEEDRNLCIVQEWEEQVRRLEELCRRCSSADMCVYIWMRALPLVDSHLKCSPMLSFCAKSRDEFVHWPLGKQRAAEFHRAREIKRRLEQCHVDGTEWWSVGRIVAWARRHAYTPTPPRKLLRTDMLLPPPAAANPETTLSYLGNLEKLVQDTSNRMTLSGEIGLQEIDVVTVDDKKETSSRCKLLASPQKHPLEFLPWEDVEIGGGCEWVGQLTSRLRLTLKPEEVAEGYTADAARSTAWRAVLSLMEDLLRSSHAQAWGDTTHTTLVPPQDITLNHVLGALSNSRPEFDIFTDYGLGIPI